jgi:hypothetical protein
MATPVLVTIHQEQWESIHDEMFNCGTRFIPTRVEAHTYESGRHSLTVNRPIKPSLSFEPNDFPCTQLDEYATPEETPEESTFEEEDIRIPTLGLPNSYKPERPRTRTHSRQIFVVRHAPHSHSKFCNEKRACDNAPKPKKKFYWHALCMVAICVWLFVYLSQSRSNDKNDIREVILNTTYLCLRKFLTQQRIHSTLLIQLDWFIDCSFRLWNSLLIKIAHI